MSPNEMEYNLYRKSQVENGTINKANTSYTTIKQKTKQNG
jgi:hypothetical protein